MFQPRVFRIFAAPVTNIPVDNLKATVQTTIPGWAATIRNRHLHFADVVESSAVRRAIIVGQSM
jgi:hypothetical protein